ncbi:MAG: GxxExxY protein [Gemmatimonadota bacterium]|nr:GxxExxY protein [Gemmatimonadota bacterium]
MEHEAVTRIIIGGAMRVHNVLGPGFLESVYQKALAWELRTKGLDVESDKRLHVRYRDALVGEFAADVVVNGCVLIEVKAVRSLASAHEAQVVNYLTATGIEIGLLLNFGSERLQFRRKCRTYRPAGRARQDGQDGTCPASTAS